MLVAATWLCKLTRDSHLRLTSEFSSFFFFQIPQGISSNVLRNRLKYPKLKKCTVLSLPFPLPPFIFYYVILWAVFLNVL